MTSQMKIPARCWVEKKIAKEKKRRGAFDDIYNEELVSMIKTKKASVDEHKEDKLARWNELTLSGDEKCRSKLSDEERKLKEEESRLALKKEWILEEK